MLISKLQNFFKRNKKNIFYFFISIFILINAFDTTFAGNPTGAGDGVAEKGLKIVIDGINYLLLFASTLIALLTSLISLLLHPGWVNGTIFGFDIHLKNIWILISNIVYFIFAFVLIVIAFMNIIGKGQDKWALKAALPKFAIGVLIVPFSWFFVQFILSISAILTVSVLGLPYDTLKDSEAFPKAVQEMKVCTKHKINLFKTKDEVESQLKQSVQDKTKCDPKDEITVLQLLSGESPQGKDTSSAVFGLINLYSYGIMHIDGVTSLGVKSLKDGIDTLADLTLKIIFDLIFLIVFLIIMVALFMAMFARGIMLWVHAMFSPVYGLLYFFGNDVASGSVEKLSIKEFISLALVPVYVAAALSFGLIFMFVSAHGLSNPPEGVGKSIMGVNNENNEAEITFGGFTLVLEGAKSTDNQEQSNVLFKEIFKGTGNALGQMMLQLFGLAILWMAVMAALKQSDITKNITQPIESFGSSMGELITKAPTYLPIIPTGKGTLSMRGMAQVGTTVKNMPETWVSERSGKISNDLFNRGASTVAHQQAALKMVQATKSDQSPRQTLLEMRDEIKKFDSAENLYRQENAREAILSMAKNPKFQYEGKIDEKITAANMSREDFTEIFSKLEHGLDKRGGNSIELKGGLMPNIDSSEKLIVGFNSVDKHLKKNSEGTEGEVGNGGKSTSTTAKGSVGIDSKIESARDTINTFKNGAGVYTIGNVVVNDTSVKDTVKLELVTNTLASNQSFKSLDSVDQVQKAIEVTGDDTLKKNSKEIAQAVWKKIEEAKSEENKGAAVRIDSEKAGVAAANKSNATGSSSGDSDVE